MIGVDVVEAVRKVNEMDAALTNGDMDRFSVLRAEVRSFIRPNGVPDWKIIDSMRKDIPHAVMLRLFDFFNKEHMGLIEVRAK